MVVHRLFDDDISSPEKQRSNEWYTPAKYVDAAREVFGGSIDLDPASCEMANRTVKAMRYYTVDDNGLTKEWCGKVWLNPPYGNEIRATREVGAMRAWIDKLLTEYKCENVDQAILCCTLENGAKWFNWLWDYTICFPACKVMFTSLLPNENRWSGKFSHFHGTIFVYLGPNEIKFIEVFSKFGRIAKAIDTPKEKIVPLSLWEIESHDSKNTDL